jgi:N-acetylneuraminic acid mutarotase
MFWWIAGCVEDPVGLEPNDEAEPADPRWVAGAPLPAPRQECGVVAWDGQVVVIGGYDAGPTMTDRVEAYDPAVDGWSAWPPLPEPLHHPNVAVLDGRIHVAGGLSDGFFERPVHWVYDPATDEGWTAAAELPAELAVGAAGAAVFDGRLHLVGGLQGTRTVALHSAYDPQTDAWERLPDAGHRRDHLAIGVAGDRLIVAAGRADGLRGFVAATEIWDGAGWTTGAPIPVPRGGVAAAVGPDGLLHVVGGEGDDTPSGVFSEHEAYDPQADGWTSLGAMATPRHGTGAAWVDGALWVPGGAPVLAFGATDTNESWTP